MAIVSTTPVSSSQKNHRWSGREMGKKLKERNIQCYRSCPPNSS